MRNYTPSESIKDVDLTSFPSKFSETPARRMRCLSLDKLDLISSGAWRLLGYLRNTNCDASLLTIYSVCSGHRGDLLLEGSNVLWRRSIASEFTGKVDIYRTVFHSRYDRDTPVGIRKGKRISIRVSISIELQWTTTGCNRIHTKERPNVSSIVALLHV